VRLRALTALFGPHHANNTLLRRDWRQILLTRRKKKLPNSRSRGSEGLQSGQSASGKSIFGASLATLNSSWGSDYKAAVSGAAGYVARTAAHTQNLLIGTALYKNKGGRGGASYFLTRR